MNFITLRFKDQILEKQYQELKTKSIRKPIYFGILSFCFVLNVVKIMKDLIQHEQWQQLYINYIFLAFMMLSIILIVQNQNFVKQALVISNLLSGLLQMNFDEQQTTKQEYYSFGSSFAQLQAASYFVSDFLDGIIQVGGHLIMKILITSLSTHKIEVMCTSFAITGSVFILVTIYICDCSSRKQFLSTVCENIWDQQLPNLIKKPFIKLSYQDKVINILQSHLIQLFPNFSQEQCDGCNGRQFLRECQIDKVSLSDCILKQSDILNKSIKANYKCHRFDLRVCRYGVEDMNLLVILEKIITTAQTKVFPLQVREDLNRQIRINRQDYLRFYNWGLMSLVLLNNHEIKEIKLFQLIKRLNKSYCKYLIPIQLFTKSTELQLNTYANLLRIYLIQIYHILIELYSKSYRIRIQVKECEEYIELHILINSSMFHTLYQNNVFIQNIQRSILYEPITKDLRIHLSKQLSFK
ncbi:unnamed protein product (macronuclear) [Paramecium tetraurelia]|uniref:Transmembrane protein n=1 Tax=Paramecium tetraurelia TaxID=5888 RepID=A0BEZ9_PARTE|nr:uncharacterized protein GSPATT00028151001 [Paramecium tetraurelia]CAK57116.1 unnamed protein product [Paramecium tetraurelia]|eukprot:XP_001424514.1 hypothetical protein (macronuclear) [Paramecium tetraurelia strain d4-2]